MNTKRMFFFVLLLIAISCGQEKLQDEQPATSIAPLVAEISPVVKRPHQISLDSSSLLIADLLKIPQLQKVMTSVAWGGTFPAKELKLSTDSSGIIFWFCYKQGKNPELFLAAEELNTYDEYNLPKAPSGKTLIRPESLFKSKFGATEDALSVGKFLGAHTSVNGKSKSIDNTTVVNYMQSFDSLLRTVPDAFGKIYNKYPFSYFREDEKGSFKKFLGQAGESGFIRYYFGFNENDKPNRIRVILVATDAAGKNITRAGAVLFENSWPPPPPIN